jgi:hypothetical protein
VSFYFTAQEMTPLPIGGHSFVCFRRQKRNIIIILMLEAIFALIIFFCTFGDRKMLFLFFNG